MRMIDAFIVEAVGASTCRKHANSTAPNSRRCIVIGKTDHGAQVSRRRRTRH